MAGEDIRVADDAGMAEPGRVAAAARLLQDPAGARSIDRLTALAARLVGCRHVHAAVLSDHLMLSQVGSCNGDADGARGYTDLCALTARAAAPLAIEDAACDDRTAGLPAVVAGQVGSYLGIPLTTRGGAVIGCLCCVDGHAHPWTRTQVDVLTDLAGAVAAELELAAVSAELSEACARHELVLQAGQLGTFDLDLVHGRIHWDERMTAMFGYAPGEFGADLADIAARVHPDDRARFDDAIATAVSLRGPYDSDFRVALPDQPVRWLRARGRAVAGPAGNAVRLMGAAYDATGLRDADAHVARILETLPSGFLSLNRQYEITYLNAAAERSVRRHRDELVGRSIFEAFPVVDATQLREHYELALRTGAGVTYENYFAPVDAWFEIRIWPSPDGFSVHFDDITERHRTQAERRAALAAREQAINAAERATGHLRLLADASARMGATLDEETVADILMTAVVPDLARWAQVHLSPGTSHVDSDAAAVTLQCGDPDGPLTPESLLTVALTSRDHSPLGTLTTQLRYVDVAEWDDDATLLRNLADRASAAIDNARLYAAQHRMSEVLQRSMLTRLPEVVDLNIVARYRPTADHAQVGGDWYDAFVQSDGRTVLVIGDVVGHDRHAAAAMGQLRNLLRGLSFDHGDSPAAMLHSVDRAIPALEVDCLATVVVACVEPATPDEAGVRRIRWANAGHLPPAVIRLDGSVELLEQDSSLLLGVDPDEQRTEHVTLLGPQDTLLLYTDGLVERRDRALSDSLTDLARFLADTGFAGQPLDEACDGLLNQTVPAKPDDDVALIAVRPR